MRPVTIALAVSAVGVLFAGLIPPAHSESPAEIASPTPLVPRGSEKPSFDCAQARTAAARLICADAELARLDSQLGVALQKRKTQIPAADQSKFAAAQVAWIRSRNIRCMLDGKSSAAIEMLGGSKPCMVREIQNRIIALVDATAGRAAEEAGNAALRTALTAGRTVDQAWEEAALAAALAALDAELSAGRPREAARRAAQQAEDHVRAHAPKARAGEAGTITVEMSVVATPTNPPVIVGATNLPDGTILIVHLLGDPRTCAPGCGLEYESVTVQNGRFTSSLKGSSPLVSGSYTIDVVTPMAGIQPEMVQSVIGKAGEHLRGPYVVTLEGGKYVPVKFPRSTVPLDSEKLFGLSIRYTQKINVGAR